jgi:hypothetical protein
MPCPVCADACAEGAYGTCPIIASFEIVAARAILSLHRNERAEPNDERQYDDTERCSAARLNRSAKRG